VAFVVRPGQSVRRVEVGPANPIDEEIAALRTRLQQAGADTDEVAERLARLVWLPLVPYLDGVHTVVMAPDADLCFVPWGALPVPNQPHRVLLQDYAFAVIGSARELIALKDAAAEPGRNGLLTVGGVDYGHSEQLATLVASPNRSAAVGRNTLVFPPLPGTEPEMQDVIRRFEASHHGAPSVRLTGAAAAKPTVQAAMVGRRFLHLATHGYFAPPEMRNALAPADDPSQLRSWEGMGRAELTGYYPGLLSGLAWAGASKPKTDPNTGLVDVGAGLMTAEEVSTLDLKGCELAVLSACETGLGRTAGGEGVLGLQRAFHQAGCRTVVASLWKVNDEATRVLMERFYTNLWEKKLPVLDALRQAQLSLLDDPDFGDGGNPRLWAAWVLSGDTGRLASPAEPGGSPKRRP
jgi:CHAT domain-containing protein